MLKKRRDIACVLVNPLPALHPKRNAPGDSTLNDGSRRAHVDRAAYTAWLHRLRQVCSERGIVLVFDEVLLGFRLAPGGAQEYFGVRSKKPALALQRRAWPPTQRRHAPWASAPAAPRSPGTGNTSPWP